jgi:hypothetical protein
MKGKYTRQKFGASNGNRRWLEQAFRHIHRLIMAIDKDKFATYLRKHAAAYSQSRCAQFVRHALEAGGANTAGNRVDAKAYGPRFAQERISCC